MTDNEVIRALECCLAETECDKCPLCGGDAYAESCPTRLLRLCANLIFRLKGESKKYRNKAQTQKGELTRLYTQVTEQKAEIMFQ